MKCVWWSSYKGFLVDHHLLLSKQRNDTELNWDIAEDICRAYSRTNVQKKIITCNKLNVYKLSMLEICLTRRESKQDKFSKRKKRNMYKQTNSSNSNKQKQKEKNNTSL